MESLRPYDITLQTKDGATVLEGILAPKEDRFGEVIGKQWRKLRGKPFADAFRTGNNGGTDPAKELFFYQTDWSEGALVADYIPGSKTYRRGTFHSAYGDLMRGIGKNIGAKRGNLRGVIGVALANPGFESTITSNASDWTAIGSGGAVDLDNTTDPRTTLAGSQHLRITATGAGRGAKVVATTHTLWRGKSITFGVYLKRAAGTTNGVKLTIDDGAGNTSSSTVTASSYTYTTVTRTIDGSSTKLEFIIQSTGSDTFDADDATIYSGTSLAPTRIATISDGTYCAFGRLLCKLEIGTLNKYRWEPVHIATSDFTDLVAYKNRLYAGLGYSIQYLYSDAGDGTTWNTATAGTTVDEYAKHFAVVGNKLWKSESDSTVRSGTAALEDGDTWTTAVTVGTTDDPITRLHSTFNTLWVGKEDGYFSYLATYDDGTSFNDFINQKPGFVAAPSSDNFRSGVTDPEGRFFYVSTGRTGFMRHNNFTKERIGFRFMMPHADIGGRIGSVAVDKDSVYIFGDDQLYSLPTDDLHPHTMTAPSVGITGNVIVSPSQANTTATAPGTASGWTNSDRIKTAGSPASYSTSAQGGSGGPLGVMLRSGGARIGNKKSTRYNGGSPDTFDDSHGSSSDLWGTTLTAYDINQSGFGVSIGLIDDFAGGEPELLATNFGFNIPLSATIDGIIVRTITIETPYVDFVSVNVYYTDSGSESAGIYVKESRVVDWSNGTDSRPNLLGVMYGLDSTDNQPIAWTDSWALPLNASTPDLDDLDIGNTSDYIEFGTWDGGEEFADVMKAIDSITVRMRGLVGTETITCTLGADGQAYDAVTVGNFSGTSSVQTLYTNNMTNPETQAIGKSFVFGISSTAATKGFAIESVTVRGHATQVREKQWEFTLLTARTMTNTGLEDISTSEEILDALEVLENSAYPIELIEDLREEGTATTTTVDIISESIEELDTSNDSLGAGAGTVRFRVRERTVN
mgnify:CR=1 FL=1